VDRSEEGLKCWLKLPNKRTNGELKNKVLHFKRNGGGSCPIGVVLKTNYER
jgi:hypothetical protein